MRPDANLLSTLEKLANEGGGLRSGAQMIGQIALAQAPNVQNIRAATHKKMVGRAGFEPATNWLKANCSTD